MKSFAFGPTGSKINTQPDSQPKKKKKKPSKITTPKLLLFFVEKMIIITLSYLTETNRNHSPHQPSGFHQVMALRKKRQRQSGARPKRGRNVCKIPAKPTKPTLSLHVLSIPFLF